MEHDKTMLPPAPSITKPVVGRRTKPAAIDHEEIYEKIEEVEVSVDRVNDKLDKHLIDAMSDHEKLEEVGKTVVKHDETLYTGSNEGAPGLVVVMGGFNEFVKEVRSKLNMAYWTILIVGLLMFGSTIYLTSTVAALKAVVLTLQH